MVYDMSVNQLSSLFLFHFALAFTVLLERDVTMGKDRENMNKKGKG